MRARICVLLGIGICLGFLGCGSSARVGTSAKSDEVPQKLAQVMGRLKSLERKQAAVEADLLPIYQIKPHADKAVETVQKSAEEVKSVMSDLTSAQGQLDKALTAIAALSERVAENEKAIKANSESVAAALKLLKDKDVELGKKNAELEAALKSVAEEANAERKKLASKDASLESQDIAILTMMKAVEQTAKQERGKLLGDVKKDAAVEDATTDDKAVPSDDPAHEKRTDAAPAFDAILKSVEQAAKAERRQLNQKDAALDRRDIAIEALLQKVEMKASAERSKLADKDKSLEQQDLAVLIMMQKVEEAAKLERVKLIKTKQHEPQQDDSTETRAKPEKAPAATGVSFDVILKSVEQAATQERQTLNQQIVALNERDAEIAASLNDVEESANDKFKKLTEKTASLVTQDANILAMLENVESTSTTARLKLEKSTDNLTHQDGNMLVMLQDVERAIRAERSDLAKFGDSSRKEDGGVDANSGEDKRAADGTDSKKTKGEPEQSKFDELLQAVKTAATAERLSSARADAALRARYKSLLTKLEAVENAARMERVKLRDEIAQLKERDLSILNLVRRLAGAPTQKSDSSGEKAETESDDSRSSRVVPRSRRLAASSELPVFELALATCSSAIGVPFSSALQVVNSTRTALVRDDDLDQPSKTSEQDSKPNTVKPDPKTNNIQTSPTEPDPFGALLEDVKNIATKRRLAQQASGTKLNDVIATLEDKDRGLITQISVLEKRLKALEEIKVIKTELAAERGRTTDLVTRVKSLETGTKALKNRIDLLAAIDNNKKDPAIIAAGELLVRRVTVVDADSNPILVLDGSKRTPSIVFHPKDERNRVNIVPGRIPGGLAIESRVGRFLFLNR